jgi:hypothetical protein
MTSAVVDVFLTYQFIKRLVLPYEQWPAFKAGIIDKNGEVLIKRKDFKTGTQRDAFRLFDLLTLNLKKLLGKLPGGKSKIATYAAALYLLKESPNITEDNMETLEEDFLKFMDDHEQEILSEMVDEDAPTVSTAGVAGLTGADLKVSPKARKKYKQHNANTTSQLVRMVRRRISNA